MSRVAKNPIEIADGVTVNFNDGCLDVKGKVGELKFDLPETVSLDIADNVITCVVYYMIEYIVDYIVDSSK